MIDGQCRAARPDLSPQQTGLWGRSFEFTLTNSLCIEKLARWTPAHSARMLTSFLSI
jgi:hypothetical protein